MSEAQQLTERQESRQTVLGFLGDLWRIVLFRPVRHGTLDLGNNAPSIAGITWGVALLYAITVVSILAANPLRTASDLESSVSATSILAVPTLLIPAVLCLLGISFGLLLAGTQRAPWWRRVLYLLVVWGALISVVGICVGLGSSGGLGVASVVLVFLVLAYCVVMWFVRTPPAVDAVVLVVLSSGVLLVAYRSLVLQDLLGTSSGELITVSFILTQVASLALPLAFMSGVNATVLGVSVVSWSADDLGRRAVRWLVIVIGIVALGWQWTSLVREAVQGGDALAGVVREGVGALVLVAACAVAWWLVHRRARSSIIPSVTVATTSALVAVPVAYAVTATTFVASLLGALVASLGNVLSPAAVEPITALLDLITTSGFVAGVRVLIVIGLIVGAVLLARRGSRLMAAIAAIDAVVLATFFGGPIVAPTWMWTPSALGNIGLIIATVVAVVWTLQRRWDRDRAAFVLVLALVSALIRQADFFAVPLGFLIGASAAALLIVGLVWGFLVDGADAHADTPGFPRDRRLLTLLGTFLFAITVVAWAVIGKDVGTSTALAATSGLALVTLGSGLIIAVVLATASPWLGRRGDAVEVEPVA